MVSEVATEATSRKMQSYACCTYLPDYVLGIEDSGIFRILQRTE